MCYCEHLVLVKPYIFIKLKNRFETSIDIQNTDEFEKKSFYDIKLESIFQKHRDLFTI